MPGYRIRVIRIGGGDGDRVVFDSGTSAARIDKTIFDKPPPGGYVYRLQVLSVGGKNPNFLTYENGIGILRMNR